MGGGWLQQNSSPFQRFACFLCDNQTFFKKLGYRFLVETTKIENTSFPFKTALSESNVKTNSTATTKWTYHKECSFASKYFFFGKFVSILEPLKKC